MSGWRIISEVLGGEELAIEALSRHALVVLKPDAVASGKVEACIEWLRSRDMTIADAVAVEVTAEKCAKLWREHWRDAPPTRVALVTLLMSLGPSLVLLLRSRTEMSGLSRIASALKGSAKTEDQRPGQLRYDLRATNRIMNLAHVADDDSDLVREMAILLTPVRLSELSYRMKSGPTLDTVTAQVRAVQSAIEPMSWSDARDGKPALTERLAEAMVRRRNEPEIRWLQARFQSDAANASEWWLVKRAAQSVGLPWTPWDTLLLAANYSEDPRGVEYLTVNRSTA